MAGAGREIREGKGLEGPIPVRGRGLWASLLAEGKGFGGLSRQGREEV